MITRGGSVGCVSERIRVLVGSGWVSGRIGIVWGTGLNESELDLERLDWLREKTKELVE